MKTDLTIGACIVYKNKVLLLHHAKLNKWLFPGGHIERDETPDQAVFREVKEETGLDFQFLQYSAITKTRNEVKLAIPFHSNIHSVGDHDHQCFYYLGTVSTDEFVKNSESNALKWFTEDELLDLDNTPESVKRMGVYVLKRVQGKYF